MLSTIKFQDFMDNTSKTFFDTFLTKFEDKFVVANASMQSNFSLQLDLKFDVVPIGWESFNAKTQLENSKTNIKYKE